MHGLLRQDAEQVDAEYGGGLGEEHELGELPADDEQRGGGRHCNNTLTSHHSAGGSLSNTSPDSTLRQPGRGFLVAMVTASTWARHSGKAKLSLCDRSSLSSKSYTVPLSSGYHLSGGVHITRVASPWL